MKHKLLAAAAAALVCSAGFAGTSSASIENAQFAVTDLDVTDGISPAFVPFTVSSGYYVNLDDAPSVGPQYPTDGFLDAPSAQSPYGPVPDADIEGEMGFSTSGSGLFVEADATGAGTALIYGDAGGGFQLTPHTSVTFTGELYVIADGTGTAQASVCLTTSCRTIESGLGYRTLSFDLTATNTTGDYEYFEVSLDTSSFATGVPELPAGVLMLTGGLFLVGVARRH